MLTADAPLVLVLEDLQWSDRSTVELLAYLAQRREPARLLVLGTYRPVEVVLQGASPARHGAGAVWAGAGGATCGWNSCLPRTWRRMWRGGWGGRWPPPSRRSSIARTDGNALFMVNIVEHLVQQGLLVRRAGQWTLRDGERGAGGESAGGVAAVAAAAHRGPRRPRPGGCWRSPVWWARSLRWRRWRRARQGPVEDVEAVCDGLAAQQHLLDDTGVTVWPDGTRGGGYRFQHALYQQVLYERWGRRGGGSCTSALAPGWRRAMAPGRGRSPPSSRSTSSAAARSQRAVHYWQQAADNAARRHAYHEAITALTQRAGAAGDPPREPRARPARTHAAAHPGGAADGERKGAAAPDVGEVYTRAHHPGPAGGGAAARCQALQGLPQFHLPRPSCAPQARWPAAPRIWRTASPTRGSRWRAHLAMGRWRAIGATPRRPGPPGARAVASRTPRRPARRSSAGGFVRGVTHEPRWRGSCGR